MRHTPDDTGHFGEFGGRFVPEALMAALDEIDDAFRKAIVDPGFLAAFQLIGLSRGQRLAQGAIKVGQPLVLLGQKVVVADGMLDLACRLAAVE